MPSPAHTVNAIKTLLLTVFREDSGGMVDCFNTEAPQNIKCMLQWRSSKLDIQCIRCKDRRNDKMYEQSCVGGEKFSQSLNYQRKSQSTLRWTEMAILRTCHHSKRRSFCQKLTKIKALFVTKRIHKDLTYFSPTSHH